MVQSAKPWRGLCASSPPREPGPKAEPVGLDTRGGGLPGADRPPLLPPVPGPCDHEDLLDGVIFGAKYLGSTQLVSERNPPPSTRMAQAREAMDRVKAPDGETQPMTEVDLFVSTKRVKVLTADSQVRAGPAGRGGPRRGPAQPAQRAVPRGRRR